MAVRRILQIEDPEDFKILKSKSKRITLFDTALEQLVEAMIETMRAADGVGLAAPQIGVLRRIVVIEEPAQIEEAEDGTLHEVRPAQLYVMINPEIIKHSDTEHVMAEGCLSLPGRVGNVPRPEWVTIKYQDLSGKEQRLRRAPANGYYVGRMAQHEIDHLDGILFTERIVDLATLKDYREPNDEQPRRRRFGRRRTVTISED